MSASTIRSPHLLRAARCTQATPRPQTLRTASISCCRASSASLASRRPFHSTRVLRDPSSKRRNPNAPRGRDRGPPSEEETQTDFSRLDVLASTPKPTSAIDACTTDGFALNSGQRMTGSGVLIVGGECFAWRPWVCGGKTGGAAGERGLGNGTPGASGRQGDSERAGLQTRKLLNERGQWDVEREVWGVLDLVWPKPDLLIIGTGPTTAPLSPSTRQHINELGIRVEVQDTRNASSQFNLLATERGVNEVAAALVPMGWKE